MDLDVCDCFRFASHTAYRRKKGTAVAAAATEMKIQIKPKKKQFTSHTYARRSHGVAECNRTGNVKKCKATSRESRYLSPQFEVECCYTASSLKILYDVY